MCVHNITTEAKIQLPMTYLDIIEWPYQNLEVIIVPHRFLQESCMIPGPSIGWCASQLFQSCGGIFLRTGDSPEDFWDRTVLVKRIDILCWLSPWFIITQQPRWQVAPVESGISLIFLIIWVSCKTQIPDFIKVIIYLVQIVICKARSWYSLEGREVATVHLSWQFSRCRIRRWFQRWAQHVHRAGWWPVAPSTDTPYMHNMFAQVLVLNSFRKVHPHHLFTSQHTEELSSIFKKCWSSESKRI